MWVQELQNDPLGILRPASKLQHNLHLASAYAAVHEARDSNPALQKQKRRMDLKYHEPKVTRLFVRHPSVVGRQVRHQGFFAKGSVTSC